MGQSDTADLAAKSDAGSENDWLWDLVESDEEMTALADPSVQVLSLEVGDAPTTQQEEDSIGRGLEQLEDEEQATNATAESAAFERLDEEEVVDKAPVEANAIKQDQDIPFNAKVERAELPETEAKLESEQIEEEAAKLAEEQEKEKKKAAEAQAQLEAEKERQRQEAEKAASAKDKKRQKEEEEEAAKEAAAEHAAAELAASEKAAAEERAAAEKTAAEKEAAEKAAAEKLAAEKVAAEKLAAEKLAAEIAKQEAALKAAAEKAAAEKAEKEAAEKAAAEKAAAEKAAAEKAAAQNAAAEKAAAEKEAAEKATAEKAKADKKAEAEKEAAEKAADEKARAEKEAAEKAATEEAKAEKEASEKVAAEVLDDDTPEVKEGPMEQILKEEETKIEDQVEVVSKQGEEKFEDIQTKELEPEVQTASCEELATARDDAYRALEADLRSQEAQNLELQKKVQELEDSKAAMARALEEKDIESQRSHEEVASLKKELEECKAAKAVTATSLEEKDIELQRSHEEVASLKKEVASAREELRDQESNSQLMRNHMSLSEGKIRTANEEKLQIQEDYEEKLQQREFAHVKQIADLKERWRSEKNTEMAELAKLKKQLAKFEDMGPAIKLISKEASGQEKSELDLVWDFTADCLAEANFDNEVRLIHKAVESRDNAAVKSLIGIIGTDEARAHAILCPPRGGSPILLAAKCGDFDVFMTLYSQEDCKKDVTDHLGNHLIHLAAKGGHREIVDFLLESAVDKQELLQSRGEFRRQILHMAANSGRVGVIECILKHEEHRTTGSSWWQKFTLVRLVFETDYNGKTPVELAREAGHLQAVQALEGRQS